MNIIMPFALALLTTLFVTPFVIQLAKKIKTRG